MRAIATGLLLAGIILLVTAADITEPQYTEDVEVFKSVNLRGRMETLLGCWLLGRDYDRSSSEARQLVLIKACMRRITRKDSVLKITSLIGKNMAPPKTYEEIVGKDSIPVGEAAEQTEFDAMLLEYVRSYAKDIDGIEKGKAGEDLKKKVEEELTKRQKYYFGIIPVNQFTHALVLVILAIVLVAVCSCWKHYTRKGEKKEGEGEQASQKSYFSQHNHKHGKEPFTKSPKPKKA